MIDYVLNVAVSISAGVGALTSAMPALQYPLHGHRAQRLCAALLRYGGSCVVINIRWYLEEPRVEEGLEQEELPTAGGRKANEH
jgi:hypothetical protein